MNVYFADQVPIYPLATSAPRPSADDSNRFTKRPCTNLLVQRDGVIQRRSRLPVSTRHSILKSSVSRPGSPRYGSTSPPLLRPTGTRLPRPCLFRSTGIPSDSRANSPRPGSSSPTMGSVTARHCVSRSYAVSPILRRANPPRSDLVCDQLSRECSPSANAKRSLVTSPPRTASTSPQHRVSARRPVTGVPRRSSVSPVSGSSTPFCSASTNGSVSPPLRCNTAQSGRALMRPCSAATNSSTSNHSPESLQYAPGNMADTQPNAASDLTETKTCSNSGNMLAGGPFPIQQSSASNSARSGANPSSPCSGIKQAYCPKLAQTGAIYLSSRCSTPAHRCVNNLERDNRSPISTKPYAPEQDASATQLQNREFRIGLDQSLVGSTQEIFKSPIASTSSFEATCLRDVRNGSQASTFLSVTEHEYHLCPLNSPILPGSCAASSNFSKVSTLSSYGTVYGSRSTSLAESLHESNDNVTMGEYAGFVDRPSSQASLEPVNRLISTISHINISNERTAAAVKQSSLTAFETTNDLLLVHNTACVTKPKNQFPQRNDLWKSVPNIARAVSSSLTQPIYRSAHRVTNILSPARPKSTQTSDRIQSQTQKTSQTTQTSVNNLTQTERISKTTQSSNDNLKEVICKSAQTSAIAFARIGKKVSSQQTFNHQQTQTMPVSTKITLTCNNKSVKPGNNHAKTDYNNSAKPRVKAFASDTPSSSFRESNESQISFKQTAGNSSKSSPSVGQSRTNKSSRLSTKSELLDGKKSKKPNSASRRSDLTALSTERNDDSESELRAQQNDSWTSSTHSSTQLSERSKTINSDPPSSKPRPKSDQMHSAPAVNSPLDSSNNETESHEAWQTNANTTPPVTNINSTQTKYESHNPGANNSHKSDREDSEGSEDEDRDDSNDSPPNNAAPTQSSSKPVNSKSNESAETNDVNKTTQPKCRLVFPCADKEKQNTDDKSKGSNPKGRCSRSMPQICCPPLPCCPPSQPTECKAENSGAKDDKACDSKKADETNTKSSKKQASNSDQECTKEPPSNSQSDARKESPSIAGGASLPPADASDESKSCCNNYTMHCLAALSLGRNKKHLVFEQSCGVWIAWLKVQNMSPENRLLFKVKTNRPEHYRATPRCGYIDPCCPPVYIQFKRKPQCGNCCEPPDEKTQIFSIVLIQQAYYGDIIEKVEHRFCSVFLEKYNSDRDDSCGGGGQSERGGSSLRDEYSGRCGQSGMNPRSTAAAASKSRQSACVRPSQSNGGPRASGSGGGGPSGGAEGMGGPGGSKNSFALALVDGPEEKYGGGDGGGAVGNDLLSCVLRGNNIILIGAIVCILLLITCCLLEFYQPMKGPSDRCAWSR